MIKVRAKSLYGNVETAGINELVFYEQDDVVYLAGVPCHLHTLQTEDKEVEEHEKEI